jgi:hypothetical protein
VTRASINLKFFENFSDLAPHPGNDHRRDGPSLTKERGLESARKTAANASRVSEPGIGIGSLSKLDIALNADASYFRIRTSVLIPGEWPVTADFVEKSKNRAWRKLAKWQSDGTSPLNTISDRLRISHAAHSTNWLVPPADFLNAALIRLPGNRASPIKAASRSPLLALTAAAP